MALRKKTSGNAVSTISAEGAGGAAGDSRTGLRCTIVRGREQNCDFCHQCRRDRKRQVAEKEQDMQGQTSTGTAVAAAGSQRDELKRAATIEERRIDIELRYRTEQVGYKGRAAQTALGMLEQCLRRSSFFLCPGFEKH